MVRLSCRLYDRSTMLPTKAAKIYMMITSLSDGSTVWDLGAVRKDSAGFDIGIGTMEMQEGHDYLVRVSPHTTLSPSASAVFGIKESASIPPIIPPLIVPVDPVDDDPQYKRWVTQLDARVCPICESNGKGGSRGDGIWPYGSRDAPKIPAHPNCRCTYELYYARPRVRAAMMKAAAISARAASIIRNVAAVKAHAPATPPLYRQRAHI